MLGMIERAVQGEEKKEVRSKQQGVKTRERERERERERMKAVRK